MAPARKKPRGEPAAQPPLDAAAAGDGEVGAPAPGPALGDENTQKRKEAARKVCQFDWTLWFVVERFFKGSFVYGGSGRCQ